MREIKFRLWDNEDNKYFEPIYEAYKGNLLDISITLSGDLLRRTLEFPAEHDSLFKDKYIIEQFTGLQDKNGVDIYEGDIFKDNLTDNEIKDYVVGFSECCYDTRRVDVKGEATGFDELFIFDRHSIEVIGNIHENPELLK